jgi:hypothetical protein
MNKQPEVGNRVAWKDGVNRRFTGSVVAIADGKVCVKVDQWDGYVEVDDEDYGWEELELL